jgi:hypothetical protein
LLVNARGKVRHKRVSGRKKTVKRPFSRRRSAKIAPS